jgi:hypothetical protein
MNASAAGSSSELILLANPAIRARRRPWAIVALWAWQAVIATLLAWPVATTARALFGNDTRGDAPLWDAGGLALMDALLHARMAGPALFAHASIVLGFALVLGLLPASALFTSLAFTTRNLVAPSLRQTLARAFAAFGPTAVVFTFAVLVKVLVLFAGVLLGRATDDALYDTMGEARAEQLGWLVTGVAFVLACGAGVAEDVARAAVIRFGVGAGRAMALGLATLGRSPVTLMWSWAWRALASLVPIAFGSLVAERLGGRGGLVLLALAVVHQVVALSRVALHTSWLAKAMRSVDAAHRVVRLVPADVDPETS